MGSAILHRQTLPLERAFCVLLWMPHWAFKGTRHLIILLMDPELTVISPLSQSLLLLFCQGYLWSILLWQDSHLLPLTVHNTMTKTPTIQLVTKETIHHLLFKHFKTEAHLPTEKPEKMVCWRSLALTIECVKKIPTDSEMFDTAQEQSSFSHFQFTPFSFVGCIRIFMILWYMDLIHSHWGNPSLSADILRYIY